MGAQAVFLDDCGGTPVLLLAAHILGRCYSPSLILGVDMGDKKEMGLAATMMVTAAAFVIVLLAFYGLDHFIMSIQGLPLNMDLSPAG